MAERYSGINDPLRNALELDGLAVQKHAQRIDSLRTTYPHSILFREDVPLATCAMIAFGFHRIEAYTNIALQGIFAGRRFMDWMLTSHLDELIDPASGALAVYFKDQEWKHIGLVNEPGRVLSKWGEFPVYEHALFEVPHSYGNNLYYCAMPSDPFALFRTYAASEGANVD